MRNAGSGVVGIVVCGWNIKKMVKLNLYDLIQCNIVLVVVGTFSFTNVL